MSDHAIAASDHDQHEDPMSHVPPPSFWPLLVGIGLTIGGTAFVGSLILGYRATDTRWEVKLTWFDRALTSVPPGVLGIVAGLMVLFTFMGWAHQVIVEKKLSHSLLGQQADLKMFIKLFLLSELTGGAGADVIYDPVGGDVFDQSLRCINWEGRLLVIGFASGRIPQAPANLTLVKNCSIVGVYWGAYALKQPITLLQSMQTLLGWYSRGQLKPHISATYPLEQVAEAMNMLTNRQSTGKVVLITR
jgi:D-arabinose 1-dehydrogenase-like Zn-dependent alcohol dehydrogenase